MASPVLISFCIAAIMFGLLIEAAIFVSFHRDQPSTYKLYSVRDLIIRLVAEKKVARNDPTLDALYSNVNLMLSSCKVINGPHGWAVAEWQGKALARNPQIGAKVKRISLDDYPQDLRPVVDELKHALVHLLGNHIGIMTQINARRKEVVRIQRERAKEILDMMQGDKLQVC